METNILVEYLNKILEIEEYKEADDSLNGLQVGKNEKEIQKVAFAVDASLESFRRSVDWGADLLLVHHGLFWGKPVPITGNLYSRIRFLIDNNLSLYAVHLPLDRHPEFGNNAVLAGMLGLESLKPFGEYRGIKIGCKGRLNEKRSIDEIIDLICGTRENTLGVLPFGPSAIGSVGIVSGGAAEEARQAIEEGLDLFITGESSHTIYHECLEGAINVLFGGHYTTEVGGVNRLSGKLKQDNPVETIFIDVPSGL